ncbi:MAG: hypothetical protein ACXABF_13880 [Candidatus Thorarchaeota archaeon]
MNFPSDLGASATSVALAIIYKSNELIWPPDFKMSNLELANLSGERLSNIGRSRQKVLDRCKIGGVPLFTYVDNRQRRAGTYLINFNLASTYIQTVFNLHSNNDQKGGVFDNDPNVTYPNVVKHNDVGGDDDNFNWLLDQFQNAAPGWCIQNDTQREKIMEFSEADRDKLEAIMNRFAERGEKRERLISWVEGGLKDFDRLYGGGNGGDAAHRAEWQRELDDMVAELEAELADPHPDNVPWVEQTRSRIANRRRMLNGGN